jgi:hypothetical protein
LRNDELQFPKDFWYTIELYTLIRVVKLETNPTRSNLTKVFVILIENSVQFKVFVAERNYINAIDDGEGDNFPLISFLSINTN